MGRRRVAILGSTGSVGTQALEVIAQHPELFEVVALVAGSDDVALARQGRAYPSARTGLGRAAAIEMAVLDDADVVLNAIVGAAGLEASLAALRAGKVLALANKESLVAGGRVCLAACRKSRASIVPVDSEHAALAQCLEGHDRGSVERIVITASGGPFRTRADLSGVTRDEALSHPTWSMGPKITIDSATLFNKGLEVIEAHFLFGFAYDDIDVVVHPQSVIHGMVEFTDGSVLMQAGPADMRIPIQAALTAPERTAGSYDRLDLARLDEVSFEPLDHARFPAVRISYDAGRAGATYPAALNAANEVAVAAFLDDKLSFDAIPRVVADVLDGHEPLDDSDLDSVLEADRSARVAAHEAMKPVTA